MRKPLSAFSVFPYERCFGSWRSALKAFARWANEGELPEEAAPPPAGPAPDSGKISLRLRFNVLQRDRFKCVACGRSPATELGVKLDVDHIIPRSHGGPTVMENLRSLCKQCNLGKGGQLIP